MYKIRRFLGFLPVFVFVGFVGFSSSAWAIDCTGANYASEDGTTCVPCPDGYTADTTDGKTAITECRINVPAGQYLAAANDTTTTPCPAGRYSDIDVQVAYGSTSACTACPSGKQYAEDGTTVLAWGTYQDQTGQTSCKLCPLASSFTDYDGLLVQTGHEIWPNPGTGTTACRAFLSVAAPDKRIAHGTATGNFAYGSLVAGRGYMLGGGDQKVWVSTCDAGYYYMGQRSNNSTWRVAYDNACSPVGLGYYSADSATGRTQCPATTNYDGETVNGTTATTLSDAATECYVERMACDRGDGTTGIATCHYDTATSSYSNCDECKAANCPAGTYLVDGDCVPCPAGSYCPEGSDAPTACPAGYDDGTTEGASAETDCQMLVAGGHYVAVANESAASGTCAKGYAKAEHLVNYGDTSSCGKCGDYMYDADGTLLGMGSYQNETGAAACKPCPLATKVTQDDPQLFYQASGYMWSGDNIYKDVGSCFARLKPIDGRLAHGTMTSQSYNCSYAGGDYGVYGGDCQVWVNTCDAGYYYMGNRTNNANYMTVYEKACSAVGLGYYSTEGATGRTQCPVGSTLDGDMNGLTDTATSGLSSDCYLEKVACTLDDGTEGMTTCHYDSATGSYSNCAVCGPKSCDAGTFLNVNKCDACPADSYCPEGSVVPTLCPEGYQGSNTTGAKTIEDCKIKVDGGHYLGEAFATEISDDWICQKGFYRATHYVGYGQTSECRTCGNYYDAEGNITHDQQRYYQDEVGQSSCKSCPDTIAAVNSGLWQQLGGYTFLHTDWGQVAPASVDNCYVDLASTLEGNRIAHGVLQRYTCSYAGGDYCLNGGDSWYNMASCDAGYYQKGYRLYADNYQKVWDNGCEAVTTGYYSVEGSTGRVLCPTGVIATGETLNGTTANTTAGLLADCYLDNMACTAPNGIGTGVATCNYDGVYNGKVDELDENGEVVTDDAGNAVQIDSFTGDYTTCGTCVLDACPTGYTLDTTNNTCVAHTFNFAYASGDGATGDSPTETLTCTYDQDCTAPANTYVKTGYTFVGWRCAGIGVSCNGQVVTSGSSMRNATAVDNATITLTAEWVANGWSMSYAAGEGGRGTGPSAPTSCTFDGECIVPANTYVPADAQAGVHFAGWACTGGDETCDGDIYQAGVQLPNVTAVNGTIITLTATWTPCTGATYCDANGVQHDCPAGYDANTNANKYAPEQCQMNVEGGHYVAVAGETAASGTCTPGWAREAHTVNYGDISSCLQCGWGYNDEGEWIDMQYQYYSDTAGAAACTPCPAPVAIYSANPQHWIKQGGYTWKQDFETAYDSPEKCWVDLFPYDEYVTEDGTEMGRVAHGAMRKWTDQFVCSYRSADGDYAVNQSTYPGDCRINVYTCDAGYYFGGARSNDYLGTKYTDLGMTFYDFTYEYACRPVTRGFWSAEGETARHLCPVGPLADGTEINGTTAQDVETASAPTACYLENMACTTDSGATGVTTCHWTGDADTGSYSDCGECYLNSCPAGQMAVDGECVPCAADSYCPAGEGPQACPAGYTANSDTGKATAQECQMSVAAGAYVAVAEEAVASGVCAAGTFIGEHLVNYGDTSACSVCATDTYSDAGAAACTACNTATGYHAIGDAAAAHATVAACKVTCNGGTYVAVAGYGCVDVGVGYWAAQSVVSQDVIGLRTACATGETTIGYGNGADEAGDCGRILHAGEHKIYLRSDKKTLPSLNVGIDGKVYYGNITETSQSGLKVKLDGVTYTVLDDQKMSETN